MCGLVQNTINMPTPKKLLCTICSVLKRRERFNPTTDNICDLCRLQINREQTLIHNNLVKKFTFGNRQRFYTMNEKYFKKTFIDLLQNWLKLNNKGHSFIKIESPTIRGIPDVNFCINRISGWMEFKYIKQWPKRDMTPIHFGRYTQQQYDFLDHRGKLGEKTSLIIRIENNILINTYPDLIHPADALTKGELIELCGRIYHIDFLDPRILIEHLIEDLME